MVYNTPRILYDALKREKKLKLRYIITKTEISLLILGINVK